MIAEFSDVENKLFYCGVKRFIDSREDMDDMDKDDWIFDTGVAFFDAMTYQDQMSAIFGMVYLEGKWEDRHIAAFLAIANVISGEVEMECDDSDSQYWRDLVWAYSLTKGWEESDREQTREEWVELVHNWTVEVVGTAHDDPHYLETYEDRVLKMCERYVGDSIQ
jgi:hypothetical protein